MVDVINRRRLAPDLQQGVLVKGIITNRHLVTNARVIIHEFGMGAYLRCVAAVVFSRRPVTFLEMVMRLPGRRSRVAVS